MSLEVSAIALVPKEDPETKGLLEDTHPEELLEEPSYDLALVNTAMKDRGDSPAQVILDKTLKAQADRRARETKYELNKITTRVEQTIAAFELNEQLHEDNKATYFVPDLLELEKIVGDAIQKKKYQQNVMIFVVGFEDATEQKLKLLNQINDFFTVYINNIDEKELQPKAAEVDLEQVSTSVQEALDTASLATQKLSEINQEIVNYVEKLHSGKALTKSKKKLEKALLQAKEDIMGLTEKLMGAQAEIEDKEDQMTKLYKQIDFKNVETLKYKNIADNAKKKLDEIEDLKLEIQERDEEIDRLNKAAFEQQLSIKQMEQSKEKSYAKLKGAHEEGEQTISKLQTKVQNLQLLLEDTKADLQKQHRLQLEDLKKTHEEDLQNLKSDLQQKIDDLESDALNQAKGWASDSDEEADIASSRHSSSRQTQSRRSVRDQDLDSKMSEASVPASGRFSRDSGKSSDGVSASIETSTRDDKSAKTLDPPSRQSTSVLTDKPVKPSPPVTPKGEKKGKTDDSETSNPKTPKRPVRNKSSLEPVHEVPYEGKITLEDEEKWTKLPIEMLPSAFKQYRKEAVLVVQGLQMQLTTEEEDHHKKVKQLREHIKEKEDSFKKEKSTLLKQIDASMKLKEAAEKEADDALAQLETFVAEHGEMAKQAEEGKKEMKKLTAEQREKFLGTKESKKDGKKSSKKGKPTSKKQNVGKSKEKPQGENADNVNTTESNKNANNEDENKTKEESFMSETGGKSDSKTKVDNDEVISSVDNPDESDVVNNIDKHHQNDVINNVDKPDDEQLAEAYEAILNSDREVKECVDRGQQTSQPVSEAHQALINKLMATGKMKPPPSPALSSTESATSSQHLTPGVTSESLDSVKKWKSSPSSVVKKPLLNPAHKKDQKAKQLKKTTLSKKGKSININKEVDKRSIRPSNTGVKKMQELIPKVDEGDDTKLSQDKNKSGVRGVFEENVETDNDTDRIEEEAMAQHLERILDSAQWSDMDDDEDAEGADGDDEDEEGRPSSTISQRSLYEKFKAQLEQKKQEVIERRSRATSMHGSLLNGLDGAVSNNGSRVSSAITTATADMGFPEEKDVAPKSRATTLTMERLGSHLVGRAPSVSESGVSMDEEDCGEEEENNELGRNDSALLPPNVIKTEVGTSPLLLTPESRDSRKSSISVPDHPIVVDYLKTYNYINDFKDLLAQAFSEKDLTIASDRLAGLKPVEFQKNENVPQQITVMRSSVELFLKEIGTVITDNLNQEPEATVSSLMTSRLNTGNSRLTTAKSLGIHGVAPPEFPPPVEAPTDPKPYPPLGPSDNDSVDLKNEIAMMNAKDGPEFKQLQDDYNNLKAEIEKQKEIYEEKLKNNAQNVVDLEETIQELQHELAGLGTSPSIKPVSSMSRTSSRLEAEVDPTVIFSRMDTERNQKALKRGINSHKISADQYNEVVRSMEQYNALPAKRLVHMVQKYTHHTHMKQIEENVKRSNSIDDEVFALLEKMEALQNMRAERWGEQMDMLAEERMRLAHLLMESLTKIEEESGIFLIKPILSWKGRGYLPHFQSKLSTYKPPKTFLRPLTREGSTVYGPAPTPTPSQTQRHLSTRQSGAGDAVMANDLPVPSRISQSPVPLQGSSIHMVGTPPQAMWSMSSSLPNDPPRTAEDSKGDLIGNRLSNSAITTPKILELDINRMLVGQNTISAPTKAFLSDDRLVNAANSSVRSYMTIARPSAYPIPSLRPTRPNSSGTENSRTGAGSPLMRSSSPKLHVRAKSESSLHVSQPLPPIKVPFEDKGGEKDGSVSSQQNIEERTGSAKSDNYLTRPITHPSPPHTPPGSSIRQSPPTIPSVDHDSLDREEDCPSPGHVTKMSMKWPTGVDEENFPG